MLSVSWNHAAAARRSKSISSSTSSLISMDLINLKLMVHLDLKTRFWFRERSKKEKTRYNVLLEHIEQTLFKLI
jgi:hypothetical protein